MAHRPEQFISLLKKEVSNFLERSVPRPVGVFVSVTGVNLASRDTIAHISISIYPEDKADEIFKSLKPYEAEARGHLGNLIKHRIIPYIIFVHDKGQGDRMRLEKLLENIEDK